MVEDEFGARSTADGVSPVRFGLSLRLLGELALPALAVVVLGFVAAQGHGAGRFLVAMAMAAVAAHAALSLARTWRAALRIDRTQAAVGEAIQVLDKASAVTGAVLAIVERDVLPSLGKMLAKLETLSSDRALPAPLRTRLRKICASGKAARGMLEDIAGSTASEPAAPLRETVETSPAQTEAEADSPPSAPAFAAAPSFQPVRPLRVLLAEANGAHQLVLRTQLAQVGIEPEIVAGKVELVEAWQREPWDLILLDAQAPAIDGLGVARMIRSMETRFGWAYTPILALAANPSGADAGAYAACGADGCVAKPVLAENLFAAIDQVLAAPAPSAAAQVA